MLNRVTTGLTMRSNQIFQRRNQFTTVMLHTMTSHQLTLQLLQTKMKKFSEKQKSLQGKQKPKSKVTLKKENTRPVKDHKTANRNKTTGTGKPTAGSRKEKSKDSPEQRSFKETGRPVYFS